MKFQITLLLLLIIINKTFSIGETAVISLEFPYGSENLSMGECGVSINNSLNSVFWNPANSSFLGDELHVQIAHSFNHEFLLPAFQLNDLYHISNSTGIFASNFIPYIDISYVFNQNRINFGENTITNELGQITSTFNSYEYVISNNISFNFANFIGAGFTIKNYKSELSPNNIAKGVAFDFGTRLQHKFNLFDFAYIVPSAGFSILNFGNDSANYTNTDPNYPLPKKLWYGASIKLSAFNFFGITAVREEEKCLISQEYTNHTGYKIQLSPFYSKSYGYMLDTAGSREELFDGYSVTINLKEVQNSLNSIFKLVSYVKPERKFKQIDLFKKFNFHISFNKSEIFSIDSEARDKQTSKGFEAGISFIPQKNNYTLIDFIKTSRKKTAILEEGDGDLVE